MIHRIHLIGQWFFLKVEALFNLAFGERNNPLYYLGPISYYLMWLVVASGLYLYAFFETSVTGAYDSVEALTHGQRYAGGILRSIHRYASDGVVITMVLHILRHFTFDRYRGFRWFSWVSGVVVLWLVYTAGINGYMLPWDRLAQFTVVATAEWLDWLPVFNGTLVRNFVFAENVNDRLFSLLSFIHIGVPLAVLAVLWIHTQRVPQARTAPPLPVALALSAALVVLSTPQAGAQPAARGSGRRRDRARLRLVLPAGLCAALPLVARRGMAAGGRRDACSSFCCRGCRRGARPPATTCWCVPTTASCRCARAKRCSTPGCAKAWTCPSNAATAAAANAR